MKSSTSSGQVVFGGDWILQVFWGRVVMSMVVSGSPNRWDR